MASLAHVRSKADLIGTLNPKAWDAVNPHGPFPFRDGFVELLVADAVKATSTLVAAPAVAKKVLALSQQMAQKGTGSLVAGWEPGDDICPPWPWPPILRGPIPPPPPEPWKSLASATQVEVAHMLSQLSALTSSKEFNHSLQTLAVEVARGGVENLMEDFERCGTVPRKPIPLPGPGK
jgi:hypothetical protein